MSEWDDKTLGLVRWAMDRYIEGETAEKTLVRIASVVYVKGDGDE